MNTKITWIALLLCVCTTAGYASDRREKVKGNGTLVTRTIAVEDFNKLNVGENLETRFRFSLLNPFGTKPKHSHTCQYTQTLGATSLEITTDENLFEYLAIEQRDGRLTVKGEEGYRLVPSHLLIKAASKTLKQVQSAGCINFVSENYLTSGNLSIDVAGMGDVRLSDFQCDTLRCAVAGVGNIYLNGKAGRARYSIAGVGHVFAFDCKAAEVKCEISGVGSMEVAAEKTLDAEASGIGKIYYMCEPDTRIDTSSSGIAKIKPAD